MAMIAQGVERGTENRLKRWEEVDARTEGEPKRGAAASRMVPWTEEFSREKQEWKNGADHNSLLIRLVQEQINYLFLCDVGI